MLVVFKRRGYGRRTVHVGTSQVYGRRVAGWARPNDYRTALACAPRAMQTEKDNVLTTLLCIVLLRVCSSFDGLFLKPVAARAATHREGALDLMVRFANVENSLAVESRGSRRVDRGLMGRMEGQRRYICNRRVGELDLYASNSINAEILDSRSSGSVDGERETISKPAQRS